MVKKGKKSRVSRLVLPVRQFSRPASILPKLGYLKCILKRNNDWFRKNIDRISKDEKPQIIIAKTCTLQGS